jgi:hypothetical protein
MTAAQSLVARAAFGSFAALATVAVPAWDRFFRGKPAAFDRRLAAAFVASRAVLYCFVFGLLHLEPRGDISYYFREATYLLHGALPYRGIDTVYAPLHTYMNAGVLLIWNSPLAIIAFMSIIECIAFPVWMRVARSLWPSQQDDRTVRMVGLLYLLCPLSLQFVTIDGQNNVVIELFFALALLLALRYRELLSGLMLGLSISTVKFLPLMFAPIFFVSLKRRWRWALGGLLGTVPVYGLFALYHLNILLPFTQQGVLKEAGGLPFWVEVVCNLALSTRVWNDLLLLPVVAVILLAGWRAAQQSQSAAGYGGELALEAQHIVRLRVVFLALGIMVATLVCFACKTWPNYLIMALFPLCFVAAQQACAYGWPGRALFALFGFICEVEHSDYQTVLDHPNALQLRALLGAHSGAAWGFLGIDLLLLAGYLWLIWLAIRALGRANNGRELPDSPYPA